MKNLKPLFSLLLGLIVLSSCSKNNLAQNSEWDDMYFSSIDREQLTASSKEFYAENFNKDYTKSLQSDQAIDYSDINYSSKTVNPEYIAKYTSDNIDQVAEESSDYYSNVTSDLYVPSSYSSTTGSNGWGIYPTFAFGMGTGYGGNPYGFRDPYGFGYGSRYNRFGSDLRYRTAYSPYGYGYYSPYNYSSYYGQSAYGYWSPYSYSSFYSPYYPASCPAYTGYNPQVAYYQQKNNRVNTSPENVISVRKVTRSPRSSRGSSYGGNTDGQRSGSSGGKVYFADGSTISTSGRSSGERNNYYRRTNTRTTSDNNTRGYQSSRTYNTSTSYTRSKSNNNNVASSYSRSSRANSSRTNFITKITNGSTSRTSGTRSNYSPSRSSSSTGTRSSYSSSSPSRSSSSGTSRSSGSSGSGSRGSSSRGSGRN